MEAVKEEMVTSSPRLPETESHFSTFIYDLSQQATGAMEELLKMIQEIEVQSSEVTQEMQKCKELALERRKAIEEEKECFQKAAFAVIDVLNSGEAKQNERMFLEDGCEY